MRFLIHLVAESEAGQRVKEIARLERNELRLENIGLSLWEARPDRFQPGGEGTLRCPIDIRAEARAHLGRALFGACARELPDQVRLPPRARSSPLPIQGFPGNPEKLGIGSDDASGEYPRAFDPVPATTRALIWEPG